MVGSCGGTYPGSAGDVYGEPPNGPPSWPETIVECFDARGFGAMYAMFGS
jgi:hypothetical protein